MTAIISVQGAENQTQAFEHCEAYTLLRYGLENNDCSLVTSKKVSVWYNTERRNETLSWQAQIQIVSVGIVCIAYVDAAPSIAVSMVILQKGVPM